MTETLATPEPARLGIGAVIGDTFSVFFRRFLQVTILGMLPTLLAGLISFWVISPLLFDQGTRYLAVALNATVSMIGAGIAAALVIRYTFDARSGRRMQFGSYFSSTAQVLGPLTVCSVVTGGAIVLAGLAFIAPAMMTGSLIMVLVMAVPAILVTLYIATLWAAVTPAIVIERAGFAALSRSPALTSNYRWPCFAAILIVVVIGSLYSEATNAFMGYLHNPETGISATNFIQNALRTVFAGILAGFLGVFSATLYARLREIKEGISVEDLAEVFG